MIVRFLLFLSLCALMPRVGRAQDTTRAVVSMDSAVKQVDDKVSLHFVEADLRVVLRALSRFLDRPLVFPILPPLRVTVETPSPIPITNVKSLIEGLAVSNQLEFISESTFYRLSLKPETVPIAGQATPRQLFVLRLRHAKAADVAATVNQLFGAGGEFTGRAGYIEGGLSNQLRRNLVPPAEAPQPSPGERPPSLAGELQGPLTVVPDELTNSLLIRGTQADFDVIRQAVEQLDARPLQVLIQVLIVEVRRDRVLSLGADLSIPPHRIGHDDATISAKSTGGGLPDFALKVMKLGAVQLDAEIRAAHSRGDAKIVSRPLLLASNGQPARILVGSQRPFVQVSRVLPTSDAVQDRVVQYQDVGTKLSVVPTINQDGYVSLDILQEVSSATGESQFGAPVISTREAATKLIVRDSQTVVIGGLRDVQREVSRSGVPVLSSIPLFGALFGSEDRALFETELFLFITPIILADDEDARRATQERLLRFPQEAPLPREPRP